MPQYKAKPVPTGAKFATAPQVCERYGGRSQMWFWRKLRDDTKFPRPMYLGRLRFFKISELEEYEQTLVVG